MNLERISIYIDSGNFYHLVLKKLRVKEVNFDFNNFVEFIANGREIASEGKRLYIGTVREKQGAYENQNAMKNQTKLFSDLINSDTKWVIKTSKLRTRNEKIIIDDRVINYKKLLDCGINEIEYIRSREKGIDVKLAIDLIIGAVDNKYDTAIIISSDSDLIPAIDWVRKRIKKKIEYIGFSIPETTACESTKPTKTMIYNSDIQRVLIESDIKPFIKKDLLQNRKEKAPDADETA